MMKIMHASNKARRGINGVAKAAGLSSAFLAASGIALAADIELNTIILPEHYQSEDDGSIVLTLKSGEKVSLSHDMFVMLDGGLILIVDETAQASLSELPVMGALRTQLLTEKLPVRSPDGGILELAQSKPVWAGEGPVPRLFEEIDIERYELAQSTDGLDEPQNENGAGQVWGLGFAGIAALGSLLTGPRGEVEGAEEAASSSGSTGGGGGGMSPPVTNFWYSTSNGGTVAENASVTLTGSANDDYFGYSAANTANGSPLLGFGRGSTAVVNAGNGDNFLLVGDYGGYSGAITYNGGSGADVIDLGDSAAASGAIALNLGDGPNTVAVGNYFADASGSVSIVGGTDTDVVTIGNGAGYNGTGTISLGAGADSVIIGNNVAFQSLVIDLENDGDVDTITFKGSVDPANTGSLVIQNFVIGDDTVVLEAASSTATVSLSTTGTDTLVTTATSNIYFTISNQTANALTLSIAGGFVEIS